MGGAKRVIVVGGGASGLMAAGRAAELGCEVLVLERMSRPASKLRISGKGRSNVTNRGSLDTSIENYGRNGKFLYGCFSRFFNDDLVEFLASRGVPTSVERGGRVFPASGKAADVSGCLES